MPGNSVLTSSSFADDSTQRRIEFFNPVLVKSSGAPSMPWVAWLGRYILFVTASDLTDARTTNDDSITRLTERVGKRQSVIFIWTELLYRSQQTGKNILDFVTELKRLATYCKYTVLSSSNSVVTALSLAASTKRSEYGSSKILLTLRYKTRSSSRKRSSALPLNRNSSARRPGAINKTL